MGCFTIYCPISGLPLNFSYDKGNENDVKYDHLNNANVVLPDGTITEIGYHDSYGRIETDDEIFSCNEEYTEYRYGIAISNSVYKLLLLHPKFIDFINKSVPMFPVPIIPILSFIVE